MWTLPAPLCPKSLVHSSLFILCKKLLPSTHPNINSILCLLLFLISINQKQIIFPHRFVITTIKTSINACPWDSYSSKHAIHNLNYSINLSLLTVYCISPLSLHLTSPHLLPIQARISYSTILYSNPVSSPQSCGVFRHFSAQYSRTGNKLDFYFQ